MEKVINEAIARHEYRFSLSGLFLAEVLAIAGEVFRRVTELDAVAFFLSHLKGVL